MWASDVLYHHREIEGHSIFILRLSVIPDSYVLSLEQADVKYLSAGVSEDGVETPNYALLGSTLAHSTAIKVALYLCFQLKFLRKSVGNV